MRGLVDTFQYWIDELKYRISAEWGIAIALFLILCVVLVIGLPKVP